MLKIDYRYLKNGNSPTPLFGMCVCAHVHACTGVCNVTAHVWRSNDNVGCLSSPSISFEPGSLILFCHCIFQAKLSHEFLGLLLLLPPNSSQQWLNMHSFPIWYAWGTATPETHITGQLMKNVLLTSWISLILGEEGLEQEGTIVPALWRTL